ncbi:MAG: hypothetical protein IJO76_03915, partial [Clostridia bacterium]|nr:hypothetical protein [Clostridia bacterium]
QKKTAARERLPEMVMRCQTSVPLPGAKPVIAPSRGYSNHQFTGGYDFANILLKKSKTLRKSLDKRKKWGIIIPVRSPNRGDRHCGIV